MSNAQPNLVIRVALAALALVPWGLSLALLYWLEYGEIWTISMPFRSLIAAIILALGMAISFALFSFLHAQQSLERK